MLYQWLAHKLSIPLAKTFRPVKMSLLKFLQEPLFPSKAVALPLTVLLYHVLSHLLQLYPLLPLCLWLNITTKTCNRPSSYFWICLSKDNSKSKYFEKLRSHKKTVSKLDFRNYILGTGTWTAISFASSMIITSKLPKQKNLFESLLLTHFYAEEWPSYSFSVKDDKTRLCQ